MFYYFSKILIQNSILNLGYESVFFWSLKGILKNIKRQEIDSALADPITINMMFFFFR